jgi:hypothetical protein
MPCGKQAKGQRKNQEFDSWARNYASGGFVTRGHEMSTLRFRSGFLLSGPHAGKVMRRFFVKRSPF